MPRVKEKPLRQATAPVPPQKEAPRDVHDHRDALARRISSAIADMEGAWRHCPHRVCRRARACRMAQPLCSAFPPAPPMSAEEGARVVAGFARLLRKRRDELARQADGIDQQS